jgi:poly(glycerol-phosphate) alpha-glucosyltransferase
MLDPWAIRHARWKKKIAAWLYENAHLRRASCLHALCESEAAVIRKLGFVNPICVIPNGIARPNAPNDLPPPWREVVPKNASVMLFLGRLHPKKNVEALLDAWPRTIEYDNWHLVIAGWGQAGHQQRLTDKIERRGLGKRVHFIGSLFGDKKHAALRHAHAFVLPSLSEGLPMAVLEAWSYGLPVLMTDACNLPEGFRTHAAVHLSLEPCRMQSDLMNFLKLDCARLEQIGRNGRRLVETQFDWGTVAEQMLAVYTWLVHGGSPPPAVQMV